MTLSIWYSAWDFVASWAYFAGLALGVVMIPVILASKKLPQAKSAWILLVLGFPWFGAFFYLVAGRSRLERRVVRRRRSTRGTLDPIDQRHHSSGVVPWRRLGGPSRDMVLGTENVGAHPPVPGNAIEIFDEGQSLFESASRAVQAARRHVHLLIYIFKSDGTGQRTMELLAATARRGVEVRVLIDGVGSLATNSSFFAPLREAGGHVASFLPFAPFRHPLRINLRNHRKLLVVDGAVAYTGGRNIGDEYAIDRSWRDLHMRVEGPVVPTLQRVFVEDWHFATDELLEDARYFPVVPATGDVPVQVVESGPDQEEPPAEELMFGAVVSARESIDIATPYLVPTEALQQALASAARRGRRVRILLPEAVDHALVRWAGDAYLPVLLDAGVCFWRRKGMAHGKALIVDGSWATMGSINLDMRSLRLNFELNLAFPHPPTALALRRWFENELASSTPIAKKDLECGLPTRFARAGAYLLSPVL